MLTLLPAAGPTTHHNTPHTPQVWARCCVS